MALLAGLDQIGSESGCAVTGDLADVVDAMAVHAQRDHRFTLGRSSLGAESGGGAVKVGQVGRYDSSGQPVLAHQLAIGVALPAQGGCVHQPGPALRVGDVVRAMAVGADGHVLVLLHEQRAPMHTLGVGLGDRPVAGGAGLRDARTGLRRSRDVVGPVAFYTGRGKDIPARLQAIVNAVQGLGVVLEMAILAGLTEAGAKLRQVLVVALGVWHLFEAGVTIGATQVLVHRTLKELALHEQRRLFTAVEGHAQAVVAVAGEAVLDLFDSRAIRNRGDGQGKRERQEPQGEGWLG